MTPTSFRNMFQNQKWKDLSKKEQLQFGVAFLEKGSFDTQSKVEMDDIMTNENYDYD